MKPFSFHGWVAAIGPDTNPNYFTGSAYSVNLNEAKVFRSRVGAWSATRYWQSADHNPRPLPKTFWETLRLVKVSLVPVAG